MGRNFPVGDQNQTIIIIHTFLSTIFFIASITATIAVISSLCGTFYRRKSKTSPPKTENETKENKDPNSLSPEQSQENLTSTSELDNEFDIETSSQQPLPPPPGKRHLSGAASYHVRSQDSSSSTTNLASSMSMRVLGNGLLSLRQGSKREDNNERKKKKDKNLKHEDSIWKKTIILGDKCKVPDEDEDEDTIICDEKGNRISTFHHKKNANSMALSRQGSAIDLDAIIPKKDDSFHKTKNTIEAQE